MFESAELGHKISKKIWKKEVPGLREGLLDAQLELFQTKKFPVVILIAGIDSRHQTLRGGFLITGCPVYLTGKVEVFDKFCFKTPVNLVRKKVVIFNSIAWTNQFYLIKSRNRLQRFNLNFFRQ